MNRGIEFLPARSTIVAFVTNRKEGNSLPPFDSFNLGDHVGDDPDSVRSNRLQLADILRFPLGQIVFMNQVHGNQVVVIDQNTIGRPTCDAMVTNIPDRVLMVLTADCVPIVFIDENKSAIGVAHAGWKGTTLQVANKTVEAMQHHYGSNIDDIRVWMGPCIQHCCYHVGNEVISQIRGSVNDVAQCADQLNGQWFLDLHKANRLQLQSIGVKGNNIHISSECTYCNNKSYYSYRAEKGNTGRFGMGVFIRSRLTDFVM
ncbi:MAG: peptidoglycan editing factor PgeF [Breznakibacter sp.]